MNNLKTKKKGKYFLKNWPFFKKVAKNQWFFQNKKINI